MKTRFYACSLKTSGQWRRLTALAAGLLLAPAAWAQIQVPAGNPNDGTSRRPLGTYYGYERSALIYTAAEIATSGTLTQLAFYLNAVNTPGAAPTKVYLKTVSNSTFAGATTVAAEETGATLVYDATIPAAAFTANTWITLPLTTPFAYNGTSNLEVIVETNATGGGNEGLTNKAFRYTITSAGGNRAQFWNADNTAPAGNGILSLLRPNIQLTGLAPLTCPFVTALSVSNITTSSAQVSFTPGAGNTSYTVTYTPVGGATTTITPAPTASPVSLTGLAEGTTYTVTIVSNCSGGASPLLTTSFTTAITPPANDNCAVATVLAPAAACTPTITTNRGATTSTGVPPPNSSATGCFVANTPVTNDVWYSIVVPASGGVTVTTSAVTGSPLNDTGMTLYTGTCGALTEVACSDDQSSTNFFSSARAIGLTPGSTVYARVWSFGTTPTGQFGICAVPVPANDAAVQTIYAMGKVLNGASQVVQAVITNTGGLPLSARSVTLSVTGVTTFTNTQTIATLAPGASTTVSFAAYTPNTVGTNTLTVTLPTDDVATNNARTYSQLVTTNTLSYLVNGQPVTASVGVDGSTPGGTLAVKYLNSTTATLGEAKLSFLATAVTPSTYQVVVLNATPAGLPGAVVFTSPTLTRPTAAGVVSVPLTGTTVTGPFFVGLKEVSGNVGIGYQVEDPLRPGIFYYQLSAGGPWQDVNTTPLKTRLGIEVTFSTVSASSSAALSQAISVFPNPSTGRVTLEIREAKAQGPLQVQVTNLLGQVVHTAYVRDNAQNPLDLSGLAEGVYVLRVQTGSEYTIRQLVLTK
ncbi:T9SS type A sorting domain-containing protein [Hymenobacter sp. BT664]|uniref:T9SS type A sorting domain-containing protein n=1 Tax=Hymenobacter montanus TaxID=2771359 RepID=A0A927BAQ0_9BACT|nr:T9SS type A sorting domain-containing protein [Hymenobacter montanus]MBD2766830.1 T9SS type A sorting domain-containing protein [Hymenobacter montanus]